VWSILLDAPLLVPIFVGVWVGSIGVTRFGWPVSGLVVPGLAASSLISSPMQFLWVIIASSLAYLLVRAIGRVFRIFGITPPFGRDRFFLVLIVAFIVQGTFQIAAAYLPDETGYWKALQSFPVWTTLLIPLTANQFWKTGLQRGIKILTVNTLVTYGILIYLLPMFTSYNPGQIATFVLSTKQGLIEQPLFFVFILLGVGIASKLNLKLGWDFGGILVPALLASCFLDPLKLFAMSIEIVAVYLTGTTIIRCLKLQRLHGIDRLRLFFTVAFSIRLIELLVVSEYLHGYRFEDFEGIGFILSAIIGSTASQKESFKFFIKPTLITVPIISVAVTSIFLVFIIPGHLLSLLPEEAKAGMGNHTLMAQKTTETALPSNLKKTPTTYKTLTSFMEDLLTTGEESFVRMIRDTGSGTPSTFIDQVVQPILANIGRGDDPRVFDDSMRLAKKIDYQLTIVEESQLNKYLVLHKTGTLHPEFGVFIFRLNSQSNLNIFMPGDVLDRKTYSASIALFQRSEAKVLFIDPTVVSKNITLAAMHHLKRERQDFRLSVASQLINIRDETSDDQLLIFNKIPDNYLGQRNLIYEQINPGPEDQNLIGMFHSLGLNPIAKGKKPMVDIGSTPQFIYKLSNRVGRKGIMMIHLDRESTEHLSRVYGNVAKNVTTPKQNSAW